MLRLTTHTIVIDSIAIGGHMFILIHTNITPHPSVAVVFTILYRNNKQEMTNANPPNDANFK